MDAVCLKFYLDTYINSRTADNQNNNIFDYLDKEWFYNMVRNACCYSTEPYDRKMNNSVLSNKMKLRMILNLIVHL
jgi:hypothetical protein